MLYEVSGQKRVYVTTSRNTRDAANMSITSHDDDDNNSSSSSTIASCLGHYANVLY